MMLRLFLSLLVATLLSSCGGGGGGQGGEAGMGGSSNVGANNAGHTLYVDFIYPRPYSELWRPSTMELEATGLEGYVPTCSLSSGSLPLGLALQRIGCSIIGTPTEVKVSFFTLRLTVPGFSGQVEKELRIETLGPPLNYPFFPATRVGTPTTLKPTSIGPSDRPPWSPQVGETLQYAVASGSIPYGLSLNSQTGEISGIVAKPGDYALAVSATVTGAQGTYISSSDVSNYFVSSEGLLFFYGPNDLPVFSAVGSAVALVPLFNFGFYLNANSYVFNNFRLSADSPSLPPGLTLDRGTGVIAGVLQGPGSYQFWIEVEVTAEGRSAVFPSSPLGLTVTKP